MSIDQPPTTARPPFVETPVAEQTVVPVTRETAEEARRHAAEIGDYVLAQRWHWHERVLATQTDTTERS
jgi:hypothetical protein